MRRVRGSTIAMVAMAGLLAVVGCGDDDDGSATATPSEVSGSPTPTPTPTPTPRDTAVGSPAATPTPSPGGPDVAGFLVVHQGVPGGAGDSLTGAPELDFIGAGYDRSLSFADWTADCADGWVGAGTTDEIGRFVVFGVPPGDCVLTATKTVGGNLMIVEVPFAVGDDGGEVVAEVSWGRVRATSRYTVDGEPVRKVATNGGAHVRLGGGRVTEIVDYARALTDADGDGSFASSGCGAAIWQCGESQDCGEGRLCTCTASCPFCDDCRPPVCAPPAPTNPYQCNDDGTCANPSDECVCASSGPGLRDCAQRVCVASCTPIRIEEIAVYGSDRMIAGQSGALSAVMALSDGSFMDVTGLVDWSSSDPSVLDVGAWGAVTAIGLGGAAITASLDGISSAPFVVDVTERPRLLGITLQNYDCYPGLLGPPVAESPAPVIDAGFVPASCADAVEIGGELQFHAFGEFADSYYEDITDEVAWSVAPAGVGTVAQGLFTGVGEGTASVSASLDGVRSDSRDIRVVTERSVVEISIYPESYYYYTDIFVDAADEPCFVGACSGTTTILIADDVQFHATARFDIGGWEDVTDQATWSAAVGGVVANGQGGLFTAVGAGRTQVRASLGGIDSFPFGVEVVENATLRQLDIYQEGANAQDRVIEAGGVARFVARGFYDVGFARDATADVDWRSGDESVARFDQPGILTGLAAGSVAVWAELDGVRSAAAFIEVFVQTDIDYCDLENVNRGTWTDGFNRVYLESDCAEYDPADIVQLRFTVTESERPGGIFDPCLDLYAFRVDSGGETFVRTIREEGCGEPFLASGAPEFDDASLRYQLQAFWDLRDNSGNAVPAGAYRIKGRFYLYYDPVVSIDITVE